MNVEDPQNVDKVARNCLGSPIQIRCSTKFYLDEYEYAEYASSCKYLREQEWPECALRELDQPPQPQEPSAQRSTPSR